MQSPYMKRTIALLSHILQVSWVHLVCSTFKIVPLKPNRLYSNQSSFNEPCLDETCSNLLILPNLIYLLFSDFLRTIF